MNILLVHKWYRLCGLWLTSTSTTKKKLYSVNCEYHWNVTVNEKLITWNVYHMDLKRLGFDFLKIIFFSVSFRMLDVVIGNIFLYRFEDGICKQWNLRSKTYRESKTRNKKWCSFHKIVGFPTVLYHLFYGNIKCNVQKEHFEFIFFKTLLG